MFLTRTNCITRYKTPTNFGFKNQEFATLRWKAASARLCKSALAKPTGLRYAGTLDDNVASGNRATIAVSVLDYFSLERLFTDNRY